MKVVAVGWIVIAKDLREPKEEMHVDADIKGPIHRIIFHHEQFLLRPEKAVQIKGELLPVSVLSIADRTCR